MHPLVALALAVALTVTHSPLVGQSGRGARPSPNAGLAQQALVANADSTELVAARTEIMVLESQVKLIREYQGSLLDTVYWALGGVLFVVSLISGFGWFANFKVYERDKESLRAELRALASSSSTKVEQEIGTRVTTASEALSQSLAGLVQGEIKPVLASLAAVDRRLFRLEVNILKEKMEANASDTMALTDALHLLALCQKRAEDELPEIIKFMLNKLDKGGHFTAEEITRVNAIIDSLPKHYAALTDRLRAKLVASDIF